MRTKNILSIFLLFLMVTALPAQVLLNFPTGGGCNYDGTASEAESIYGFEPSDKAQAVIDEIMSLMGLSSNFELMAANVDNALAHVQGGQRFILYNERFMNQLFDRTADYWASVSILAHEIGHHLNGHTLTPEGSRPELELAADQFSGFVLYKLGATQVQAELAVQTLANDRGTSTHPPKRARLQAVAVGYRQAREQAGGVQPRPKERQPSTQPERTKNRVPDTAPTNSNNQVTLGGKTYATVRLNGLTWMAQNLDYEVADSWCYKDDPTNCQQYGRLYTWEAAKQACRAVGWRLPTEKEWKGLVNSVGGYYDWPSSKKEVGNPKKAYQALLEGGKSGFAAQLGGNRNYSGGFYYLGNWGHYWSATEQDSDRAWFYGFYSNNGKLYRSYGRKSGGSSCRCVQGAPSNGID